MQLSFLLCLAFPRPRKWVRKKGVRSLFCCCCRAGCVGKKLEDTEGSEFIPLNTHVQVERFDLFVVLTLGECIAGADVKGNIKLQDDPNVIFKIIAAILTGLCIKFLAFDYAEHPTVSASNTKKRKRSQMQHAFSASSARGVAFILLYIPFLLGVLCVASILEDQILHDGLTDRLERCVYGLGCFLIVLSTTMIQLAHQGKRGGEHRIPKRVRISVRVFISLMMLFLPFFFVWCDEVNNESKMQDAKCKSNAIVFEFLEATLFFFTLVIDRWMRHPKKDNKDYYIYNAVNQCCSCDQIKNKHPN